MRCREARNRIAHSSGHPTGSGADPSLLEHLRECPTCAAEAEVTGLLSRLLEAAAENDLKDLTPFEVQRQLVLARARSTRPQLRLLGRPAFRAAVAAVAAVVIVLSVVPFATYDTVGYDLNLNGVSLELAQSDDGICDLLHHLGLFDAGVDVIGCDTTCCLAILDLKSEQEAIMVVGAIARINDDVLTTSITPIRAKTSRSLLDQAGDIMRRDDS